MYFSSRHDAGEMLAERLMKYRYEDCAVVALTASGVSVAEPVAARLHCMLGLFLSEPVKIPGEDVTLGTVMQDGDFMYNSNLSKADTDEYYGEFHSYIDAEKREKFEHINHLIGEGGAVDPRLLREHVVIVVADGLRTGAKLRAIADYLKPIKMKRLVLAVPIASVEAVDEMHIVADELHVLSVTENFLATTHYYDTNDTLTHEQAVEKINNIILNWR